MATYESLYDAWESLARESWAAPGTYERRVASERPHHFFALYMRPENTFGLALELPASLGGRIADESARGFVLSKQWRPDVGRVRLTLALSERRFHDVFRVLALDVFERVQLADTVEAGSTSFAERLAHWKRFLSAAGDDGLSSEAQIGLFGELYVLHHLISRGAAADSVLLAWTGPAGGNQDFVVRGRALEVKTTTSNDIYRLRVSNERQLDESGLLDLLLCHLVLDRSRDHGVSLVELVHRVLDGLEAASADRLNDLLGLAGYHPVHESRYADTRYECRFARIYRVGGSFPRLKQNDLRSGVSEVRYSIDLANIDPQALDLQFIQGSLFQSS